MNKLDPSNIVSKKVQQQQGVLQKYLPEGFVSRIHEMLTEYPLDFKIVRPRKTKLGDYRYDPKRSKPVITVNSNLNPYQFLVTTVHELAHFHSFRIYGHRIKAHGAEWKKTYQQLSMPFIDSGALPKKVESAWLNSLISVKASSCADPELYKVLREFDKDFEDKILLEQLAVGTEFELNGKTFRKGKIRRKRYICTEVRTNKQYLVSPIAEVKLKESENGAK